MSDSSNRDVELFTEALRLPVGERAAFLARACRGDTILRDQVENLLKANDEVGDFLAQPANTPPKAGIRTVIGEGPGHRIGRYKLLQQIGEGGCGVVFMAEQEEPVRRRVALKIIKPGMDTRSVIARFEAERQALALMDHPNIAKVFDAGATESGRPYFVMELIRGTKITEYCDQHSLTTEDRLLLFVQVCQAVQHAHQKGVIHRDIKPSNILVTTTLEGSVLPVVIDFGVAKATADQRLTDKTLFTAFEMLIGTPAYMSPEQAALSRADVDTRTDIYSLGVLLYELLTGFTPFNATELLKAGLDEVRRVIREQEPIAPSTRLSTMQSADLTTVADHRRVEPPSLIRSVSGDLDWIVMKSLEKDRTRRYETANGLAMDVKRYIANEPIVARPPSKLYRFQKILQRNKLLFSGIGVVATLLLISLVVVSTSLARERTARREAEMERRNALNSATKSQQVTHFLETMLQGVEPSVALGRDTTMLHEILDRTAGQLGTELVEQPEVEAELRSLLGQLYYRIGDYAKSEEMQNAALAKYEVLCGAESAEAAACLYYLSVTLLVEGKTLQAEQAARRSLDIRQNLFGNDNADVASSMNSLANVYRQVGKLIEAEVLARESLRIRRHLFGGDHLDVADSMRNLAILLGDGGQWPEAERTAREVLAIRRTVLGPEHPWVASALNDVAWAVGAQPNRLEEAESLERDALAMRQKLLGERHPDQAKSLYLVGDRLRQRGKLAEAHSTLSATLAVQRKVLGVEHPDTLYTMFSLGSTLESEGNLIEAEQLMREALGCWRKRGEVESGPALSVLNGLARVLLKQGKNNETEQWLGEVLTPDFVRQPASADFLSLRCELLARRSQWVPAAADAVLVYEHQPGDYDRFSLLAALLAKNRDQAAYDRFCQDIIGAFVNTTNPYAADQVAKACLFLPTSQVDLRAIDKLTDTAITLGSGDLGAMPYFQLCKSLSEYRLGHYAEAVYWAEKPISVPGLYAHGQAYAVQAMAYWQLGQTNQARAALAKGEAAAPPLMPVQVAEDPGNAWAAWLYARVSLEEARSLIHREDAEPSTRGAGL